MISNQHGTDVSYPALQIKKSPAHTYALTHQPIRVHPFLPTYPPIPSYVSTHSFLRIPSTIYSYLRNPFHVGSQPFVRTYSINPFNDSYKSFKRFIRVL